MQYDRHEQTAIWSIFSLLVPFMPAFRSYVNFENSSLAIALELPQIQIHPEQFETIIVNLLDNAIKYTPEGGEVKLSAHIIKKTETDNGDHYLQINVQDTGIGIPPQDLSHIFERFYQVDKVRSRRLRTQSSIGSGVGLGLSIIQEIVYTHSGQVWVESTQGVGTLFRVEFQAVG